MAFKFARLAVGAGAVLAWAGAACSSSSNPTGPATAPDTAAAIAAFIAAESSFTGEAFNSFASLPGVTGGLGAVATPARLGLPEGVMRRSGLDAIGARIMTGMTQRLLPHLAPTVTGGFITDSLLGKTLTFDTVSDQYVVSNLTGAPSNALRVILYTMANDTVAKPLNVVGRVDIFDLSSGSTKKGRFLITGVGGSPTYFDATDSYQDLSSGADSGFKIASSGLVSNGLTGAALHTLNFSASLYLLEHDSSTDSVAYTFNINLNKPQLSGGGTITASGDIKDTTHNVADYDSHLTAGGQTVRATLHEASSANGTLTVLRVYVENLLFAQAERLNNGAYIWTDGSGNLLTPADQSIAFYAWEITIEVPLQLGIDLADIGVGLLQTGI